MLDSLKKELQECADEKQAEILQRFFKTGKGEYGEGDIFLGIKVPAQRQISKKYNLELDEIQELLKSDMHEHRLIGLFILIDKYEKSLPEKKHIIFDFYLQNIRNVNNWDLVDLSAPRIVGDFLSENSDKKQIIYDLAQSDNLWKKRIAIVSTFAFIKNNEFEDTLAISEILLDDSHDLIHKAVGWMLREVGKKNQEILEDFLKKHYKKMPRTMLRYSIERFDEEKRKRYLRGEI